VAAVLDGADDEGLTNDDAGRPAQAAGPEAGVPERGADAVVPAVRLVDRTVPVRQGGDLGAPADSSADGSRSRGIARPVVIGSIEVHVESPAAQPDPFAGCRFVADGLTARRGGGW
jgi:hypothetical protein